MSAETSTENIYGILAEVRNPHELIEISRTVNKNGYKKFDTFSPFPVHGIDRAMGLQKSRLGWIVLIHGLIGLAGALSMIYFMMAVDYPLNISGKSLLNVPAWIPVTFELTVLLSAFGAVFGMLFLNGLPKLNHPLFNSENFKKATIDGFFICIESDDPQFNSEKVHKLFSDAGAVSIEEIHEIT